MGEVMKHFIQITVDGRVLDAFYLPNGPDDRGMYLGREIRLIDLDGQYAGMAIGERIQFSGQTFLKRII